MLTPDRRRSGAWSGSARSAVPWTISTQGTQLAPDEVVAERLATKARAAVDALSAVRDPPRRRRPPGRAGSHSAVGRTGTLTCRRRTIEELELMLRMERALRVAKDNGSESVESHKRRRAFTWAGVILMRKRNA